MSTLKTTSITHGSNSGTANVALASNGNVTIGGAIAATSGLGKVLQFVYETVDPNSTAITTSGGTESEVIDATITPSSTSSKILVIGHKQVDVTASGNATCIIKLYRGALGGTEIIGVSQAIHTGANSTFVFDPWIIDSPSTTSAQEYTMSMARSSSNTTSCTSNLNGNYHLLLVELGA